MVLSLDLLIIFNRGDFMITFYFTATGNCLYVAKRINQGELISIPQALKKENQTYKSESIGFVFPCYGFGVPKIVQEFISKNTFISDYFFTVMTYGNIASGGLGHMEKICKQSNITFNYTAEILMVDNYLPVFKIEDQLAKEASKKIEENLEMIVQDISQKSNKKVEKCGTHKVATAVIKSAESTFLKSYIDKKFYVNESCNKCGTCAKVCPRKNISVTAEKVTYLHNCEVCMACINLCPKNAIHLKNQRSESRFKNQNVTLKELIDANNQL